LKPLTAIAAEGREHDQQRQGQRDHARAHEVEVAVVREEFHVGLRRQIEIEVSFLRR
jgi:hypothetical protein